MLAGCTFDPSSGAVGGAEPEPVDASAGGPDAAVLADAGELPDAAPPDAAEPDAAADAAVDDLCPGADGDTVALYRFDAAGDLADSAGDHDGELSGAALQSPNGPSGCGRAVAFAPGGSSFIEIDPSDDFDLTTGSIDLFVRSGPLGTERGIVSRDAIGIGAGHFTAVIDASGRFVVRLQAIGVQDDAICSDQLAVPGQWHHLAINFGAPRAELFLDGVLGTTDEAVTILGNQSFTCNTEHPEGIDTDGLPWVFGAENTASDSGDTDLVAGFFEGGAIDQVRISSVRRDFAR